MAAALVSAMATGSRSSERVTVTDLRGRSVSLTVPVERVILGEGRQITVVAALDRRRPFARIVGWRDDLIKSDPDTYGAYLAIEPTAAGLPIFGGLRDGLFDVEQAISLKPDVVIMNLEAKSAADEVAAVERLAGLGIAVVYIDFRQRPFDNTEPSIRLLGKLFGRESEAEELIRFRAAEIARVVDRLAGAGMAATAKPLVMVERIAGLTDECCPSFGPENFGRLVEMAGGRNLGSRFLSGTFGVIHPEAVVAADPDVLIATGGNWGALAPGGSWVGLGPGADLEAARRRLAALARRPAYAHSKAVKDERVHAIWHQFYNNLYQFAALQQIAHWLHPDLFGELDADATMKALHDRFLPVPYRPGYWVSLAPVR